ncbi:GNAT family N-acetyltransferase [Sphingomonas sp.]|uniref:GNAT family N-acetyltransferase n=1 Tax=Sphingomonas sp. TaxID=28214 RepID=UPI003B3A0056
MPAFPKSVLDYWHQTFSADHACVRDKLSWAISERLNPKRPAMVLETTDGAVRAVFRPEIAEDIRIGSDDLSAADLKGRLNKIGIGLRDPDYLFYLPAEAHKASNLDLKPRQLTEADRPVFQVFYKTASEQDREDAWVELDHRAVFGCFGGDRLVSAASMNLWEDSTIADLGVLTLPDARGRGFARAVVGAINRFSRQRGYEPQYRCQLYNSASITLARSCGLMLFGQWTVATSAPATGYA